jgi:hypothetical protein
MPWKPAMARQLLMTTFMKRLARWTTVEDRRDARNPSAIALTRASTPRSDRIRLRRAASASTSQQHPVAVLQQVLAAFE